MTVKSVARGTGMSNGISAGRSVLLRTVALLAVVTGWQILGLVVDSPWIPPVTDVIARIVDLFATGRIVPALTASMGTLIAGYAICVVVGVGIGTLMSVSTVAEDAFQPFVEIGLMIPHIVFAPVFFAFFGLSDWTLIAVVVIFAVFAVIVNTQTAIIATDGRLRDMAVSFGATRFNIFWQVMLPEASPMIFAGLRVAMGRAVKGLIVGEVFVTVVGLGALERQFSSSFDGSGMWAIATIVIVFAVILTSLVQVVDRRVNAWTRR
jgi:NitT/TauT family transport system permease protein